jgi:hypothetical protein
MLSLGVAEEVGRLELVVGSTVQHSALDVASP